MRLEDGRDVISLADFECDDLNFELVGHFLNLTLFQHGGGIVCIGHDAQSVQVGQNFAQKLNSLSNEISPLKRRSGGIAARSGQALYALQLPQ
jgi:hypothetical protein